MSKDDKLNNQGTKMDGNDFITWLSNELIQAESSSTKPGFLEEARELVNKAIIQYANLPMDEKAEVFRNITTAHTSGSLGNYTIKYDKREEYDYMEGLLATIEACFEDQLKS